MKRVSIVMASLLVFGLVALPALASPDVKGKDHDVTVEFVSYDAQAKTVTFKTETGEEKTAPVMEKAAKGGTSFYKAQAVTSLGSGLYGYTVRVLPHHPDLVSPFLPGLITWATV